MSNRKKFRAALGIIGIVIIIAFISLGVFLGWEEAKYKEVAEYNDLYHAATVVSVDQQSVYDVIGITPEYKIEYKFDENGKLAGSTQINITPEYVLLKNVDGEYVAVEADASQYCIGQNVYYWPYFFNDHGYFLNDHGPGDIVSELPSLQEFFYSTRAYRILHILFRVLIGLCVIDVIVFVSVSCSDDYDEKEEREEPVRTQTAAPAASAPAASAPAAAAPAASAPAAPVPAVNAAPVSAPKPAAAPAPKPAVPKAAGDLASLAAMADKAGDYVPEQKQDDGMNTLSSM